MPYLLAGPFIALVGILAVYFVFRRKAVDKQSMYSARRKQIEHKVRAARQRTLAPHGHAPAQTAAPELLDQRPAQPTVSYPTPAYAQPAAPAPTAPPPTPAWETPAAPQQVPWEQPPTPGPAPAAPAQAPNYDWPQAPAAEPVKPAPAEPFQPPQPPSEPAWTPAPRPSEPATPIAQPAAASTTSSVGGWSIVTTTKDASASAEPDSKHGDKSDRYLSSSWQLASGEAPSMSEEEGDVRRGNQTLIAAAQYAVLVVGLVMVLIGVIVMVANSHVT